MTPVDLCVLGGGVTGLGLARLAARHGLSVVLVERGDLVSGASSATSHLLHGGLRYLEHGHFALVREALRERAALLRMAPSLAQPVRFLAPVRRSDRVRPWKLRVGLALYDVLAGSGGLSPHAWAGGARAVALEPALSADGLLGCGLYSDAVVDDARLGIAVAEDAAAHGARLMPQAGLVSARPASEPRGGCLLEVRRADGALSQIAARVLVNATGAWSDATRRELLRSLTPGEPDPAPRLAPSRGVHLVYPALTRSHAVISLAADGRAWFVVPFAGRSLVGTTEVVVGSPPPAEAALPTVDEIRYLHAATQRLLPGAGEPRPLAVYSGLRPLLAAEVSGGAASREHAVFDDGAFLSVAGGKYTTFRAIAAEALRHVLARLGRGADRIDDRPVPLPAPAAGEPEPQQAGADAAERQFALRLDDVMRRRTRLWLRDDRGLGVAAQVADGMARRLGWSPERQREERDHYEHLVHTEQDLLARALAAHAPLHDGART